MKRTTSNHLPHLPRAAASVLSLALCLGSAGALAGGAKQAEQATQVEQTKQAKQGAPAQGRHKIDHSGKRQVGEASFYADKFAGRKMANGKPMKPDGNNAASKTLPLGTTARVTNLDTGESAKVTIADRGPYVPGRIVDLSPATAREIGLTREEGVAPVEVAPIAVPQPDGGTRPGDGALLAERSRAAKAAR